MFNHQVSKALDRRVRAHGYVTEGSPVIRDQVARAQPREELERVFARQMSLSKRTTLPPRRIADRQEGDVQFALTEPKHPLDEKMRRVAQPSVAGEEAALLGVLQQIHVGRRSAP